MLPGISLRPQAGVGVGQILATPAPIPSPEKWSTPTDSNSSPDSNSAALVTDLAFRICAIDTLVAVFTSEHIKNFFYETPCIFPFNLSSPMSGANEGTHPQFTSLPAE